MAFGNAVQGDILMPFRESRSAHARFSGTSGLGVSAAKGALSRSNRVGKLLIDEMGGERRGRRGDLSWRALGARVQLPER
jgi:hypothetical protein